MTQQFIVCMGGNGSLVLESIIHMCAMGAMNVDKLHVLLAEIDQGNGNLDRTKKTYEAYTAVQNRLNSRVGNDKIGNGFFHTQIELYLWLPLEEGNAKTDTITGMLEGQRRYEWLQRVLYDQDELNHVITVGFKGHPNLGMLFMQNILKEHGKDDQINAFIDNFGQSQETRMLFIGSCFGGTGAACLPALKKYIATQLKKKGVSKPIVYGMLVLLPFFRLFKSKDQTLQINSDEFDNKLATVLSYYQNFLLKPDDQDAFYQHIYLLGSQNQILYPHNQSGRLGQRNPSSYITWFACCAVLQFFGEDWKQDVADATKNPNSVNKRTKIHIAWQQEGAMDWGQFDATLLPQLQQRCALMLQVAVFYYEKLHRDSMALQEKENPIKHIIGIFKGVGHEQPNALLRNLLSDFSGEQIDRFYKVMQEFHQYLRLMVSWMFDIATHVPLDKSIQLPSEANQDAAEKNNQEMLRPYLEFHHMSVQQIKKVLQEVTIIGTADDQRLYYQEMQRSLTYQRYFNAYILCKLRQGWQGQVDPNRKATNEADEEEMNELLKVLMHLWAEGKNSISNQPIGVVINWVTMTQYLAPSSNLEDIAVNVLRMMAEKATKETEETEEEQATRLIATVFRVLMKWHNLPINN